MPDLFVSICVILLLLGAYVGITSLERIFAVKLTVLISDQFTEIFDAKGISLLTIPNKVGFAVGKGEQRIIVIDVDSNEEVLSRREKNSRQIFDLVFDQENWNQNHYDIAWRQLLVYGCEKARQILKKRWVPLKVIVRIKTSDSLTDQRIREAVLNKSLRAFGEFKVADTSNIGP